MAICRRCLAPVALEPDFSKPAKLIRVGSGLSEKVWFSHPMEDHPSGLCWFHLKKEQGLFEESYPLHGVRPRDLFNQERRQ